MNAPLQIEVFPEEIARFGNDPTTTFAPSGPRTAMLLAHSNSFLISVIGRNSLIG